MSGVATATIGGTLVANELNKKNAPDTRPQFAKVINPLVEQTAGSLKAAPSFQTFQGDRVAGFTGDQNQAFGMTPALVSALQGAAGTAGSGFQTFGGGEMVGNNPYLDQAIAGMREEANRDFERTQLPNIRNNAITTGGIGGSRQGIAEGLALSDLNRDLINKEGTMRQDQFNADLTNQLQALINQGNILSGQTAGQELLFGTGAVQQGQNQDVINAEMQKFDEETQGGYNRDLELLRILMGAPSGSQAVPYEQNPLASGLGTGLAMQQLLYGNKQTPEIPAYTGVPGPHL